jgi:hypothetical protein
MQHDSTSAWRHQCNVAASAPLDGWNRDASSAVANQLVMSTHSAAELMARCGCLLRGLSHSIKAQAVETSTRDAVRFPGRGFDADRYDLRDTMVLLPVVGKLLLKMLQKIDLICMDTPSLTLPQCDVFDVWIPAL